MSEGAGGAFDLGNILSSLSAEDMGALGELASSLFAGSGEAGSEQPETEPNGGFSVPDLESMAKIASVLQLLQSDPKDPRRDLLLALRPLLGEARQKKVDQASRMLVLMQILPKIKELGLW